MIGLDTWFFFQLRDKNPKAVDFWKSVARGKERVMISVVVLYELGINMYAKGESIFFEDIKRLIKITPNIRVVDLDFQSVINAVKIKHSYGSPTIDTLIVASYVSNKCKKILTEDRDIVKLDRKGVIKVKKLK